MSQAPLEYADFVRLVTGALEAAGIEYLVGGALAAWAWGEPRATLDVDLVVDIPLESIAALSTELASRDMLVPADIILEAILEERSDIPISATHLYSGFKADLYPLRHGDELRRSALQRRKPVDLGPQLGKIYLHSPEDLILYKLWYYSLSQQTKHLRDITAIVLTLGDELEMDYINEWAARKGLTTLWEELFARIQSKAR
ncbi:MAG: hypothetical protein A2Z16_07960 [Chloroflexi bacterium RBG_16_54_18]|nr:MAG: hypothetical protein A2Z16_07960 [Chloroflexi bacterium RBG_16_54_18]